ncbi:MAG: extracellular solute-binding protein [Deltaproteobacteria bacterium]|nr:extracellular solute-binding protein [Deltaproteobacteria bacterium]
MAYKLIRFLTTCAVMVLVIHLGEPLAAEDWKKEYDELVAKAKQEGEVVVYSGRGRERRRARTQPFEEKFGIKVSYISGRSNELFEKIKAERGAGLFEGDIFFGRPPDTERLMREKALAPLKPLLFLPDVTDTSHFFQGKHWYTDPGEKYAMIFAAYQGDLISINTHQLNADSITSMSEVLLNPKFKGRIVINDPEPGGGANGVLIWMYVSKKMGPEFVRRLLTEMEPGFQQDCRQAVDLMAKGVYDIALFCYSDVRRAKNQGLPVLNLPGPMKEGALLQMGGSNQIAVLANPAHPNAQKLYVNWWLSREGQMAFQKLDRDYQSVRTDLPLDPISQERRRREGTEYVFTDASKESPQWAQEVNELWWKIRRK